MSAYDSAMHAYAGVPPEVLWQCEFRLSAITWEILRGSDAPAEPSEDDRMFGRPIRIDDTLPTGMIEVWQKVAFAG